ncbi:hypothetical protein RCL_jg8481.t1 [Rhizophagus clarus]|uniref:Uncharacterized protein n=1 Tax=Rhizophagus clarus TaxID=94130 RepID=A0A8H3MI77_9GLOM|nr:hypothetical protein RCL_jg8481.t1 [Rhizophagus clarus]
MCQTSGRSLVVNSEVKRPFGLEFLVPQNSEICDKRSLDFWHSLGVEYAISGFLLKWSVQNLIFRLPKL